MSKLIYFSDEARERVKKGIDILADAVKVTMGAKGRYVIIGQKFGAPTVTKDGVSVANEIELEDPIAEIGARMVKEVAKRTVKEVGDGTTSSIVLARALATAGLKNVTAGANPMDLKRGMDMAVAHIVKNLKTLSVKVDGDISKIRNIAKISANNDEVIGNLIADAVTKVGMDGLITFEDAKGTETEVKFFEGMEFDKGWMSNFFVNNMQNLSSDMNNPLIALFDCKVNTFNQVIPLMEIAIAAKKEVLIIAEDVDPQVLTALVNNRNAGGLRVTTVLAPGFGDTRTNVLTDIAAVIGATVLIEELGMKPEDVTLEMLGTATSVVVGRESTTIIGGAGDKKVLQERIKLLEGQLKIETEDHVKLKFRHRIGKLSGGVAVLYVGAITPTEQGEKRDRVEDALAATRAAIEEGIVPGGGVALIRSMEGLDSLVCDNEDIKTGVKIVQKAVEAPLRQIMENAGVDSSVILQKVREGKGDDFGYNVKTDEYEKFYKSGIIDPTKVTRVALENASSIASMLITSECVIVDKPEVVVGTPPLPYNPSMM